MMQRLYSQIPGLLVLALLLVLVLWPEKTAPLTTCLALAAGLVAAQEYKKT